jgi:rhamnose transport system ATP-binding protein
VYLRTFVIPAPCGVGYDPAGVSAPVLEAVAIFKSFAGIRALRGVSFEVRSGEVHALVGENGAGKSTLIRIVTGADTPDAGTILVSGQTAARLDPATARALGIAAIYQHPVLFPDLTVAENIALPLEGGGLLRRVDWTARRDRAAGLFAEIGAAIDPRRRAGTLSLPERQLVEIAKALAADARIVIMDEPTASLTDREVDALLAVVARLRARGAGVIYISHKIEEVFAVADRITVLRDGESVATRRRDEIDRTGLVRLMVGREVASMYPKRQVAFGAPALELSAVSNGARGIGPITFTVLRGEIVGMAGLVGSGRTELAETIFGLTPRDSGEIRVNGAPAHLSSPADAMRHGLAYVPQDRQQHGVIGEMSVAANTTLNHLAAVSSRGIIDAAAEERAAATCVERLRIKTASVRAAVGSLSGGNQQKVALARWLAIDPSVLILDEPTQGIDVGAKAEIHELIELLAERGVAILMISSDLPELLAMADRIAVMRGGSLAGILPRDQATPDSVMALALGHAA